MQERDEHGKFLPKSKGDAGLGEPPSNHEDAGPTQAPDSSDVALDAIEAASRAQQLPAMLRVIRMNTDRLFAAALPQQAALCAINERN